MQINREKEEKLIIVGYSLWLCAAVLGLTLWTDYPIVDLLCKYIKKFSFIIIFTSVIYRRDYTRRDLIGAVLLIFSIALAGHSVKGAWMAQTVILVYFSGRVDFQKLLKVFFTIQTVIMVLTVTASQRDILNDLIWDEAVRARHSLGYDYCGYPAHLLLFMMLAWFCIRNRIVWYEAGVWLVIQYVCFVLTDSRTDFYLCCAGIFGGLIWQFICRKNMLQRLRTAILLFGFGIIAFGSIILQWKYDQNNAGLFRLNTLLNGRLHLGHSGIVNYGIKLFGSQIRWVGMGSITKDPLLQYNYVDCSFLKELLTFGVVFFALLMLAYYFLGKLLCRKRQDILAWAVIVSWMYGVMNAHLCVLAFNVFFLALGGVFADVSEEEITYSSFFKMAAALLPERLNEKWQHRLRICVMLAGLFLLQYLASAEIDMAYAALSQWIWIGCGLLAVLLWLYMKDYKYMRPMGKPVKKQNLLQQTVGSNWLVKSVLVYLLLVCVSDFFINKRYRYAGFCMLLFGYLGYRVWKQYADRRLIIAEFCRAYEIWFAAVMVFCVFCRPLKLGICYAGPVSSSSDFSAFLLAGVVVLLYEWHEHAWNRIYGAGAMLHLYLIMETQEIIPLLIAGSILIIFVLFVLAGNREKKATDTAEKIIGNTKGNTAIELLKTIAAGAVLVFLIKWCLAEMAMRLGTEVVLPADQMKAYEKNIVNVFTDGSWLHAILDEMRGWKRYLGYVGWRGHEYLPKIKGERRWADNAAIMVLYRYGIIAGAAYLTMIAAWGIHSLRYGIQHRDFFIPGMAVCCFLTSMFTVTEKPFMNVIWVLTYAGMLYVISAEDQESDS